MKTCRANPRTRFCFIRGLIAWGALLLVIDPSSVRAGDDSKSAVMPAPASADPFVQFENQIKALGDKGILLRLNYTGEEFANLSGGLARGSAYDGLVDIALTLDLKKIAGWNGATFYASVLYPHGDGISQKYTGDYNVLSNIDAYDSFRLYELWLQQKFDNDRLSIRAGQLVVDNNFFVSDNAALFINSIFGVFGTVAHNLTEPTYPVGGLGILLRYDPKPSFYWQTMVADGNPGTQNGNDKHGVRFNLSRSSGAVGFTEASYVEKPPDGSTRLRGTYKIGGFYDTSFYEDNSGSSLHHGNYGAYAIVDHQLYRAPGSTKDAFQGLGAFSRISFAPDDRNPVFFYFDTGINYTGLLPTRPKDIFGVAFSWEKLSDTLLLPSGANVPSHRENVLEVTYVANLNDFFSLQPDFQYIINPGGFHTTPNAIVAGLRFNVTF